MPNYVTGKSLGIGLAEAMGLSIKGIKSIKIECEAGEFVKVEIIRHLDLRESDAIKSKLALTRAYLLEEKEEDFVDYC